MYWSEAMGNEMRIRVKELSSPRLIQGKLVVDEDTTTRQEKIASKMTPKTIVAGQDLEDQLLEVGDQIPTRRLLPPKKATI